MDMIHNDHFECLTEAIYHEARGEQFSGQLYVGFVIRNRVDSIYYPDDFCSVVRQPWQFSYHYTLSSLEMNESYALKLAKQVAYMVLSVDRVPISKSVLYYHSINIKPKWNYNKIQEYKIVGNHIFYESKQ